MRLSVALALLIAAAAGVAAWALPNRPVPVGDHHGRLSSVSFAPFRDGQSPLIRAYPSPDQIEEDLAVLAQRVAGVRTYTSLEGMNVVPPLAARHGLTVIQGVWLSDRTAVNEREVVALIDAANRFPDTVTRVIVGNEVLLRGELHPAELAGYIRRVRRAVDQPVSYADVWEYWLRNPELAEEVDFITIHVLPYWEDDPVGVEHVTEHILAVYNLVKRRFPDKPVMIGETGWPTAGRSREEAVPSRVNAATFLNAFLDLAAREGFDYNVIEAFDQPWKSAQEGTVGANWGLFDAGREPKFALDEPVSENPHWPRAAAATVGLGLVAGLWLLPRRRLPWPAVLGFALLAELLAGCLVLAGSDGFAHSYSTAMVAWTAVKLALQAALALIVLTAAAHALRGGTDTADGRHLGEALIRDGSLAVSGIAAYAATSLVALALSAALVADPRYRDFPIADFLVPTVGLAAFKVVEWLGRRQAPLAVPRLFEAGSHRPVAPFGRRGRIAAALVVVLAVAAAAGILLREGPVNREAMVWIGMLLVLTVPWAATLRRGVNR